jgi:hypothetical protein
MSGISNLNIVVQQGGNSQEVHSVKQQSAENTQMVAAQEQAARTEEAKARVPDMEGSEKTKIKRDKHRDKKGDHPPGRQKKEKKKEKQASAATGNLLDTVV